MKSKAQKMNNTIDKRIVMKRNKIPGPPRTKCCICKKDVLKSTTLYIGPEGRACKFHKGVKEKSEALKQIDKERIQKSIERNKPVKKSKVSFWDFLALCKAEDFEHQRRTSNMEIKIIDQKVRGNRLYVLHQEGNYYYVNAFPQHMGAYEIRRKGFLARIKYPIDCVKIREALIYCRGKSNCGSGGLLFSELRPALNKFDQLVFGDKPNKLG